MPRNSLRNIKRRTVDPADSKKSFGKRGADKREVRRSKSDFSNENKTKRLQRRSENDNSRENFEEFHYSEHHKQEKNIPKE